MKAIVNKESLLKVLDRVQAVADSKSSMAILGSTLVSVQDGQLTFTATDLEMGYQGTTPAETNGEGAFCLPARKLYEIVKNFPEETLLLEKEEEKIVLKDQEQKITYQLAFSPAEDFPNLPEVSPGNMVSIAGETLKEMLKKTIFAAVSSDKASHIFSGVFIVQKDTKLRMVATDGHQLSLIEKEVPEVEKLNLSEGVIVPYKAAKEIMRMASKEAVVGIGVGNGLFLLTTSEGLFMVRLIEGRFPDLEPILAQEQKATAVFDRKQLVSALKRTAILSNEKYQPVKFEFSKEKAVLTGSGKELGEVREKLPVAYDGDPFSVFFNARYLLDALNAIDSTTVTLGLGDLHTPTRVFSPEESEFLALVMPMAVK